MAGCRGTSQISSFFWSALIVEVYLANLTSLLRSNVSGVPSKIGYQGKKFHVIAALETNFFLYRNIFCR